MIDIFYEQFEGWENKSVIIHMRHYREIFSVVPIYLLLAFLIEIWYKNKEPHTHQKMEKIIDLLPVTIALILFVCSVTAFPFFKRKTLETLQEQYLGVRNNFFESIPAKEILIAEDFQIMKTLVSSSEIEGVYLLLSKNIIEEQAHANEEVQFQLKIFLDKALPIINSMDNEDENRHAIITEIRKLFDLYANKETRELFQGKKLLHLK